MKYRLIAYLGIFIPMCAIFGFCFYFLNINTDAYTQFEGMSIAAYNISILPGIQWMIYFNYIGVGSLIILFVLGLLSFRNEDKANFISKLLLLSSGICWTSFGLFEAHDGLNMNTGLVVARIGLTLIFGMIGFFLMSNSIQKLNKHKIYKWLLFSCGIIILINGFINLFYPFEAKGVFGLISWFVYFSGFGVIGLAILEKKDI